MVFNAKNLKVIRNIYHGLFIFQEVVVTMAS